MVRSVDEVPVEASAQEEALREEVRAWLGEHWDPSRPRRTWLAEVVDARWAAPSWPERWYGRDLAPALSRVVAAEFARAGAPGAGQDAFNLWANTVLAFGSDELRRRFVRPLLLDEVAMCLLYSEPGAGSDLAALATRADPDGDEFVVNGQKVWTSGARQADYALLVARTDWDAPKHRGITFFLFPMKQPGVEVRPIRQATGDSRFNEVFLTDARVPAANVLGEANQGWRVLQTALAYERAVMGESRSGAPRRTPPAEPLDATSEATAPAPDLVLVDLARATGRAADPLVRQALARLHCLRTVNQWNGLRARAQLAQGTSSPLASLGKLAMSGILHYAAHAQATILGAEAMLGAPDSSRAADATYAALNAYFTSIGGGTDQIQRNIIGERLLGLPREPEVDKDVPFREARRSAPVRPLG